MKTGRKYFLMIICLIFTVITIFSYELEDFDNESTGFLELQNNLIIDCLTPLLTIQKSHPFLPAGEVPVYGFNLSFGSAIAPLYVYNRELDDFQLFDDPASVLAGNKEEMFIPNLGFSLSLPISVILVVNAGYLPPLEINTITRTNLKINTNVFYRVLDEIISNFFGMYLGGGYTYCSGLKNLPLDLSYAEDTTEYTFNGILVSNWNYHTVNIELLLHQSVIILNFYGRINYCWLFGNTESTITGTLFETDDINTSLENHELLHGLVLSCGMELVLADFRLTLEAGRDWLASSFFGSAAIRLEL